MSADAVPGLSAAAPCPCGSGATFGSCCGPFLAGQSSAPSAETLMRSRYCAYVTGNSDYLLATWHATTRPPLPDLSADTARWRRLVVVEAREDPASDRGEVEFAAAAVDGRQLLTLHERSRFMREGGQWFYLDGEARWERSPLPGRNDPCCCGSGKKFKKCCG